MALLPYAKRVSTQRNRPPRDGRRDRDEGRSDVEQNDTGDQVEGLENEDIEMNEGEG